MQKKDLLMVRKKRALPAVFLADGKKKGAISYLLLGWCH